MPCFLTVCGAPDLHDISISAILLLRKISAIVCFPEFKIECETERETAVAQRPLTSGAELRKTKQKSF